jgi:hypothetical protein
LGSSDGPEERIYNSSIRKRLAAIAIFVLDCFVSDALSTDGQRLGCSKEFTGTCLENCDYFSAAGKTVGKL